MKLIATVIDTKHLDEMIRDFAREKLRYVVDYAMTIFLTTDDAIDLEKKGEVVYAAEKKQYYIDFLSKSDNDLTALQHLSIYSLIVNEKLNRLHHRIIDEVVSDLIKKGAMH